MNWLLLSIVVLHCGFSRGKAPLGSPSKYNSLPNTIKLVIRYSRTDFFSFHLEKIPDNVEKVKVVVGNKNGYRVSPQDPNKHFSIYKDSKYQATFTVSDNGHKNKVYYGAFIFRTKMYTLEPSHPNDRKIENVFDKDYVVTIENLSYHLREKAETSHGGNDRSLASPNDTNYINQDRKGDNRRFVGEKQLLTIEVLVVLDYSTYSKWMKFMNENHNQAIENMKYYYTEVVNVIKMKYEDIEMPKYKFTVALAGFYIGETPQMVPFIENTKVKTAKNEIRHEQLLMGLSKWITSSVKNILPRFDVAALFTNYFTPGYNGYAYISGVCSSYGVSITKDNGPFKTADTAAHELGHNLGANHDGEGNDCRYIDHHVMVSGKGPLTEDNYNNTFYFSRCSLKYFLARIYYMNRNRMNCLEDYPESSIPLDTSRLFNGSLGQKFSPDEQCKIVIGPKSQICSRGNKENMNLCFAILCKVNNNGRCFPIIPAFGTSCGKKSWCIKGKCVRDEKAPEFRDHCLLGDSTDLVDISTGSKTCKELVAQNPKYCSQTYYKDLCCESCGNVKDSGNKNCPYGDQNLKCDVKYCASPYYRIGCCETCKVLANENLPQGRCEDEEKTSWCRNPSGHTCYKDHDLCCVGCAMIYDIAASGCEYGDHSSWCYDIIKADPSQCKNEEFSKPCCHSCKTFAGKNVTPKKPASEICIDKTDCNHATSYNCYQLESECCTTCKRFVKKGNEKNCKYGDRFEWCSSYVTGEIECQTAESIEDCCQSCRRYVKG